MLESEQDKAEVGRGPPPTPAWLSSYLSQEWRRDPLASQLRYRGFEAKHREYLSSLKLWDDKSEYWSGRGEKFNLQYESLGPDVQRQLKSTGILGNGSSGSIHRIVCNQIPLARKSIRAMTKSRLTALQSEVEAVKRLESHQHIVKLVGTYISTHHEEDMLHILTFPVAQCDLDKFLSDLDRLCGREHIPPDNEDAISEWSLHTMSMLNATGLWMLRETIVYPPSAVVKHHLYRFVKQAFGCISSAILWIHTARIAHDDLKPANILLHNGRIYITDFGISRDRSGTQSTSTELFPGSTPGWTAPEKGDKHNPFQTDIYSLGCIFMHMTSVRYGARSRASCSTILQSSPSERETLIHNHLVDIHRHLRAISADSTASFDSEIPSDGRLQLIKEMLKNDGRSRPTIADVSNRLITMSKDQNFRNPGDCCILRVALHEEALQQYFGEKVSGQQHAPQQYQPQQPPPANTATPAPSPPAAQQADLSDSKSSSSISTLGPEESRSWDGNSDSEAESESELRARKRAQRHINYPPDMIRSFARRPEPTPPPHQCLRPGANSTTLPARSPQLRAPIISYGSPRNFESEAEGVDLSTSYQGLAARFGRTGQPIVQRHILPQDYRLDPQRAERRSQGIYFGRSKSPE